jgi:hypothetical protein
VAAAIRSPYAEGYPRIAVVGPGKVRDVAVGGHRTMMVASCRLPKTQNLGAPEHTSGRDHLMRGDLDLSQHQDRRSLAPED